MSDFQVINGMIGQQAIDVGKVKASFADDANCYLTSTAGSLDDAVVAGDRVHNCIGGSAIDTPSTGLALLELNYPHTDDIAD